MKVRNLNFFVSSHRLAYFACALVLPLLLADTISAQTPPQCNNQPIGTVSAAHYGGQHDALTLTTAASLPPNTSFVTATIVKNNYTYVASGCSTAHKLNNALFVNPQPSATGIGTQAAFVNSARETSWAKSPVNLALGVTLPMSILFQPPLLPGCSVQNPTRTAVVCIKYTFYWPVTCSGAPVITSCSRIKAFSLTYNDTSVSSFTTLASCPYI